MIALVRQVGLVALVVTSVVLAILVGKQIHPDAAAMLLGLAAGFLVSLPLGVAAMIVVFRRHQSEEPAPPRREGPPVVIVAPGSGQHEGLGQWGTWQGMLDPQRTLPGRRHFSGLVSDDE